MTPEHDAEVAEHLVSHHSMDTKDIGHSYGYIRYSGDVNEYRGMSLQGIHNLIHKRKHFWDNSIEHEHTPELLEAYAQAAHYKHIELQQLIKNSN